MIFVYIGFLKFKKLLDNLFELKKQSFFIVITPFISLLIIYNMVSIMDITVWVIVDIIGICIINIIMFYTFEYINSIDDKKREDELIKQQNIYYNRQFELMRESNEKLHALRHDLKNHTMYMQSKSGEDANIFDYKDELDSMLGKNEYAKSGNLLIDSILNFKINEAVEKGFKCKLKLIVPDEINIKETDLVILFGNMIDNSIEHCLESEKEIRLAVKYESGILYIDSSNASQKITIVDGKIITSKLDKKNHGMGLKNITRVVEKYNGEFLIENENDRFRISIMMQC